MHPYEHMYKTYDFFKLQTMVFDNFKIEAPKFLTRKTYQINRNAIAKLAIISNLPKSATILGKFNPLRCTSVKFHPKASLNKFPPKRKTQ